MRALVTGGGGFIGSSLAALLLEAGHEVTVLDDFSSGYRENLAALPDVRVVEGDVRDAAAVERACAGAEVVFHTAASVGNARSLEDPVRDSEINVVGTLRVLQAARRAGSRRIVYSSSAAVCGEPRALPLREDHPVEPTSPYGVSKLAAEKHCLAYGAMHGMTCVCLRYFNVYGVNQRYDAYGSVIPIFTRRMIAGEPITVFGDGEQTRDFVNVRDVARANLLAGTGDAPAGVYNVGAGARISVNRLAALLQEAAGREAAVQHAPPRPGDLRDSLADVSAAKAAFGFAPSVAVEDGLREYVAWAAEALR